MDNPLDTRLTKKKVMKHNNKTPFCINYADEKYLQTIINHGT